MHRSLPLLFPALLVLGSLAGAQSVRSIRTLTTAGEVHQDARISPDGQYVVWKGPNKLGIAPFSGGAETPLVASSTLGDFLWAPTSSGIYYLDGTTVKFIARAGGVPKTLQTIAGGQQRLWCVSPNDALLYGSRYDTTTSQYAIYTLATSGTSVPKDLITSALALDAVRIDPTNQKMLYREYVAVPFSNREYWRADKDGKNPLSLTGGPVGGQIDHADFVDAGTTIVYTTISPNTPSFQLARLVAGNTTAVLLSEAPGLHRRSAVSGDQKWVIHEALTPPTQGTQVAILPPDGGGLVILDPSKTFTFTSNPSTSSTGLRVAFSGTDTSVPGATSQVHVAELDRELRLFPKLELGKVFQMALPLASTELGVIFVGAGLAATPITLPGFLYTFDLNLSAFVSVIAGPGTGGLLQAALPLPNDPALAGQDLFWQGVRIEPVPQTGEFTRYVITRVF